MAEFSLAQRYMVIDSVSCKIVCAHYPVKEGKIHMPTKTGFALSYDYYDGPVGRLLLAGQEQTLHLISFANKDHKALIKENWVQEENVFQSAKVQLDAYFSGALEIFDLPLHLNGSPFQNEVWRALCNIPFGETITYGELATRVGRPRGAQAVGAANGANPLPIVIPCHRVIGANNTLTGFGGGIETKRFLLEHEIKYTPHKRLI
jgi:methylated-DNA-[protein]-cysteine S-methyltransferase